MRKACLAKRPMRRRHSEQLVVVAEVAAEPLFIMPLLLQFQVRNQLQHLLVVQLHLEQLSLLLPVHQHHQREEAHQLVLVVLEVLVVEEQ